MGTSVNTPAPRDYSQETRDTLQAQVDLAPQKYASEAQYAPLYQNLQLGLLGQALPQLLGMYTGQVGPALSDLQSQTASAQRGSDIQDVANLGPQAMAAQRLANPGAAGLVDTLTQQAQQGLAAGTGLTPEQTRALQQQSRGADAARGFAAGPASTVNEIVRQQAAGTGAQAQRQQMAAATAGGSQAFYGDPFQQILGRPSQAMSMTPGVIGQAQGFNPGQLFNPESQYSADIYNQGWQGQLAANTASAANKTAINSALIGIGAAGAGSM